MNSFITFALLAMLMATQAEVQMAAQPMASQLMAAQSMTSQPMASPMMAQPMRPMMQSGGVSNAIAPVKQDVLPDGSMRIDLSAKQVAFVAGGVARIWKHRTLAYNVLTGKWSEIDGTTAVLDVLEFEVHLWIAQKISNYISSNLPIQGMGNAFVQLSYLALADAYLTRQRLKGLISGMDETKVSFANEVAENFDFLGNVVVAKLASQVNLKETGQVTTFVINGELQDPPTVTAFIFRIEGHVVYKVALFHCKPKHVFVRDKKTHVFLELANDDCQRTSDDVVYMMNLK